MTMDPRVKPIIDLLVSESCWRGFSEARRYIRTIHSMAEVRALTQAVESTDFTSRNDFEARLVRIACVASFSTENLRDPLLLHALDRGLFCRQYHAPFGQLSNEIRDPSSPLYQFSPDLIVLVPSAERLLSRGQTRTPAAVDEALDALWDEIRILRETFGGPVLVVNFLPPELRPFGILDPVHNLSVANFYRRLNLSLDERCARDTGLYPIDAAHLCAFSGIRWTTLHTSQFLANRPIPESLADAIARDVMAIAAAMRGLVRKCLISDLDNTLWGGIVGEDGLAGIHIGGTFPGNLFSQLQEHLLSLFHHGVLLGINSKNNDGDVWECFHARKEMILKRGHFSCVRINWQDKVTNLREMAEEVNLGLDSVVVLDDSPIERSWIEERLPEVYVIPADEPLEMLRFLHTCRLFDSLNLTEEDGLRARSYAAAAERTRLASEATDLKTFLRSLEIRADFGVPTAAQLGRVAQLTLKTNQFNITARRYTVEHLSRIVADPAWRVFYCSSSDRFADEGIIGVAIVHIDNGVWVLNSFLMSCRALGRGIERAFLAWICQQAYAASAVRIRGEYIRTPKNGQTTQFFRDRGFKPIQDDPDHGLWDLQLPAPADMWPGWICASHNPSTPSPAESLAH